MDHHSKKHDIYLVSRIHAMCFVFSVSRILHKNAVMSVSNPSDLYLFVINSPDRFNFAETRLAEKRRSFMNDDEEHFVEASAEDAIGQCRRRCILAL